MKAHFTCLW